jgi:hypothetical protein
VGFLKPAGGRSPPALRDALVLADDLTQKDKIVTVAFDPDRTTVVAMYGPKPAPLTKLITNLQVSLQGVLGQLFAPRPIADIHSTIIGLDLYSGDAHARDVPGILGFLFKQFQRASLTVQYGGYDPRDHRMLSRGASLYERSLVLDGDKVVLIGWPVIATVGTDYTAAPLLANIRHDCEQFGVRHKYHADPTVDDPDSYMNRMSAERDVSGVCPRSNPAGVHLAR